MLIGENIKKARKENKLTQTELADKIDKSLRMVQKYESGEVEPSIEVLNDIAKVLGTNFIQLLESDEIRIISTESGIEIKPKTYLNASLVSDILNTTFFEGEQLQYTLLDDDLDFLAKLLEKTLIETVQHLTRKNFEIYTNPDKFSAHLEDYLD